MPSLQNYKDLVAADNCITFSSMGSYGENEEEAHFDLQQRLCLERGAISYNDAELLWQKRGSSVSHCPPKLLERLEIVYEFRSRQKILDFLQRDCFLLSVLFGIYSKLIHYFQNAPISLDVEEDPETEGQTQLLVQISTNLSPIEAMDKLDQFDDEYWLSEMGKAKGKIIINLEFK